MHRPGFGTRLLAPRVGVSTCSLSTDVHLEDVGEKEYKHKKVEQSSSSTAPAEKCTKKSAIGIQVGTLSVRDAKPVQRATSPRRKITARSSMHQ